MFDIVIPAAAGLVGLLVIGIIFARLYHRASKEVAFVRTGFGGEKVVKDGGALILPVLHEIISVNMNTLRLEVQRVKAGALITRDRMRVDVTAEFYVRVKPDSVAISTAAQTLGQRTMNPDSLKELVEGKFVDSLRSVASGMAMEELHENRGVFVQKVQQAVSEDLNKNGLELETVSLTSLDQTDREYFNANNAFDAQGLTKLTQEIQLRAKERNDIERDTKIQIEAKNLETERLSLSIARDQEYARLSQDQEVKTRTADATAQIAMQEASKRREAEQARIDAERAIAEAEIAKKLAIEQREIERQRAVQLAQQEREIVVAAKSEEQSAAKAKADSALSKAVAAEEDVKTVREIATAEREKGVRLVEAREEAERQAIAVTVSADAEKQAADDRAAAVRLASQGEADAVRIRAEADAERYRVEAEGQRAINEARNALSVEQIRLEVRLELIKQMPAIIEQSVKPMLAIDGIKIIDVRGLSNAPGGADTSGGNGVGNGNLAQGVVDHALRYRAHAPLVDSLTSEIGVGNLADLSGLLADGGAKKPDAA